MLGKKPAKHDDRNLLMKSILKPTPVAIPTCYSFDNKHRNIPTPMFGNDRYGDCVIAGRAHQTLRFEHIEQNTILKITDQDVITEWRKENGNTEDGLCVLDSLTLWRNEGWDIGGKNYKIKAFAQNNPLDKNEIKSTIFSNIGIGLGLSMPDSWEREFNTGKPWKDTTQLPNPYNGHYVYVIGYDKTGLTCITWAKRQKMSWSFFTKYTDEAYAIMDATDIKKVDVDAVNAFLENLE